MFSRFYIERALAPGRYALREAFRGIGRSPALRHAIPDALLRRRLLRTTDVEICATDVSYMRVSAEDGHILVGLAYLQTGPEKEIYLDLVHELTHVRQFHEGAVLYDRSIAYVDRPTEIEAYTVAVAEARRIGYTDAEIHAYLDVHWVTEEERSRLAERLGVRPLHVRAPVADGPTAGT